MKLFKIIYMLIKIQKNINFNNFKVKTLNSLPLNVLTKK